MSDIARLFWRDPRIWIPLVLSSVGLTFFAETAAAYGDEGFHLVAAKLINAGRVPYRDFFYQHPPTYAYVCALWMRAFGATWQSAHALSACLTVASLCLVARFSFDRIPEPKWKATGAGVAVGLTALNAQVVNFATIGQPYALAIFLAVVSLCLVSSALERTHAWRTVVAGICAGGAASASLLTLPVAAIELAWSWWHSPRDGRWRRCAAFAAGAAMPFLPLLWVGRHAPGAAWFDVVTYQVTYRGGGGPLDLATIMAQARELAGWLNSAQAMLLVALGGIGWLALVGRRDVDPRRTADLRLCGLLAIGVSAFLAIPNPTFAQYFVVVVPFAAILAAVGVCAIGARVSAAARAWWLVLPIVTVFALDLGQTLFLSDLRYGFSFWREVTQVMAAADRVTPAGGLLYAPGDNEYFASSHEPPPGLENSFALWAELPAAIAARGYLVPQERIDEALAHGRFATVLIDVHDERIETLSLSPQYAQRRLLKARRNQYLLLWDRLDKTPRAR